MRVSGRPPAIGCSRSARASPGLGSGADTCARLGGDEFGVLLDGDPSAEDRSVVADGSWPPSASRCPRVRAAPSHGQPRHGDGLQPGADAIRLLRNAQLARSVARVAGGDQMVTFEPAMEQAAQSQVELETELRGAVAQGQLVLLYQPIVDLQTGELAGAEALVRWDHPTRGRLGPGVFIPLAEETGLIDEIGTWCCARRAWRSLTGLAWRAVRCLEYR